jgi:hypothetical protein
MYILATLSTCMNPAFLRRNSQRDRKVEQDARGFRDCALRDELADQTEDTSEADHGRIR